MIADRGASEIKEHKVFSTINWGKLEAGNLTPVERPQAAAFSEENSIKTAGRLISQQSHNVLILFSLNV